jgi:hypothetical protein
LIARKEKKPLVLINLLSLSDTLLSAQQRTKSQLTLDECHQDDAPERNKRDKSSNVLKSFSFNETANVGMKQREKKKKKKKKKEKEKIPNSHHSKSAPKQSHRNQLPSFDSTSTQTRKLLEPPAR